MARKKLLVLSSGVLIFFLYVHNLLAVASDQDIVHHHHHSPDSIQEIHLVSNSQQNDDYSLQYLGAREGAGAEDLLEEEAVHVSPVVSLQSIAFAPPFLDFGQQYIGMPCLVRVVVMNPGSQQPLQLTSISGDSLDFHSSFFRAKVVKSKESTTFDVVFLARVAGEVQDTLYIHTSLGTFAYRVRGVGVPNPYRLRALIGARIPVNATYSPVITMHNPHNTTLQITEIYSSGGELHLELLSSQPQGSRNLWIESKPVLKFACPSTWTLSYNREQTLFKTGRIPFEPVMRPFLIANHFDVPIVLYDVKFTSKVHNTFSILKFQSPFILSPNSEWSQPFLIQFHPTSSECLFNSTVKFSTNASHFTIPLHCYDGRMKYTVQESLDKDVLDYGHLSESDVGSKNFTIENYNPIRITVIGYTISDYLPHTKVEALTIRPIGESGNGKLILTRPPHYLEPGYEAVFRVNVSNPTKLGTFNGEIVIYTSFDRKLYVPVYYKTAVGELRFTPSRVVFEPTFPFGTSNINLLAKSSYTQPVRVSDVLSVPNDSRFYIKNQRIQRLPKLRPQALTEVGTLTFDPLLGDGDLHYLSDSGSHSMLSLLRRSEGRPDLRADPSKEIRCFQTLWNKWNFVLDTGKTMFNFSFKVLTDAGTEHSLPAEASLRWPSIVSTSSLEFPLTTIGKTSSEVLFLSNPSDFSLTLEPMFLQELSSNQQEIVDLVAKRLEPDLKGIHFTNSASTFTIHPAQSSIATLPSHSDSLQITVAFSPTLAQPANGLLLIWNNLTVLDFVVLQGKGTQGVFTIDGVYPSTESLLFEPSTAQLEMCQSSHLSEPFRIVKSVRLQNLGSSPITVVSMEVGGGGCEERGFSVPKCKSQFVLQPNRSKDVDIIFTSEFTLSRVSNSLRVKTSVGAEFLFPLLAVLPYHWLSVCYAAQPHPEWEKSIAWFSFPFWLFLLFILIIVAIVHSHVTLHALDIPVQSTGGKNFSLSDLTQSFAAIGDRLTAAALRSSVVVSTSTVARSSSSPPSQSRHGNKRAQEEKEEPDHGNGDVDAERFHDASQDPIPVPRSTRQQHSAADDSHGRNAPVKTLQQPQPSQRPVSGNESAKNSGPSSPNSSHQQQLLQPRDHKTGIKKPSVSEPSSPSTPSEQKPTSAPRQQQQQQQSLKNVNTDTVREQESTVPATKKPKVVKKSIANKAQKSQPPSPSDIFQPQQQQSPPNQQDQPSSPPQQPSTQNQPNQNQQTVQQNQQRRQVLSDQLVRKESEVSLKSNDSDTSSTASSDRSEEREDSTRSSSSASVVGVAVETELKSKPPSPPSLTKEPGTGQTVPMSDMQDSADAPQITGTDAAETHPSPSESPSLAKKDLPQQPPTKVKSSKKKMKQQQKREEKHKRREKEREEQHRKQRVILELANKQTSTEKEVKMEKKPEMKEQTPSSETQSPNQDVPTLHVPTTEPSNSEFAASTDTDKNGHQQVPPDPDSKRELSELHSEERVGVSADDTQIKKVETPGAKENTAETEKPKRRESTDQHASGSRSKGKDKKLKELSATSPVTSSVPSSAVKMGKFKGAKTPDSPEQTKAFEKTNSSKSGDKPRRSERARSVGSDRGGGGRGGRRGERVHRISGGSEDGANSAASKEEVPDSGKPSNETDPLNKNRPQTLEIAPPPTVQGVSESQSPVAEPCTAEVEPSGQKLQVPSAKSSQNPTSPHELAASLLTSAIRKKQHEDETSGEPVSSTEDSKSSKGPSEKQQKPPSVNKSPSKSVTTPTTLSLNAPPFYPSTSTAADVNVSASGSGRDHKQPSSKYGSLHMSAEEHRPPHYPERKQRKNQSGHFSRKPTLPPYAVMMAEGHPFFGEQASHLDDQDSQGYGAAKPPPLGGVGGDYDLEDLIHLRRARAGAALDALDAESVRQAMLTRRGYIEYQLLLREQQQLLAAAQQQQRSRREREREHRPPGFPPLRSTSGPSMWDLPARYGGSSPSGGGGGGGSSEEEEALKALVAKRQTEQYFQSLLEQQSLGGYKPSDEFLRGGEASQRQVPVNLWDYPTSRLVAQPSALEHLAMAEQLRETGSSEPFTISNAEAHARLLRYRQLQQQLQQRARRRTLPAQVPPSHLMQGPPGGGLPPSTFTRASSSRSFSGSSDIGGETVPPDFTSPLSEPLDGVSRAPGSGFSGAHHHHHHQHQHHHQQQQQQQPSPPSLPNATAAAAAAASSSLSGSTPLNEPKEQQQPATSTTTSSTWNSIWGLDSPFTDAAISISAAADLEDSAVLAASGRKREALPPQLPRSRQQQQQQREDTFGGAFPTVASSPQEGTSSSSEETPFTTYGLFQQPSIWGNGENSSLFSWTKPDGSSSKD